MDMELLQQLHSAIPKELLRRITDGEATAADLSVAVKFLKDNGIDCYGAENPAVSSLADRMQFPVGDDDEDRVIPMRR